MKTFLKWLLGATIACGLVGLMAAGVTGEFTQVNSVNGYQVNGAAGISGQALCSNGTYFATACNNFTPPALTGTSGYQKLSSGLIIEWGISSSFDTGPQSQTLPFTFPTACLFASAGDNTASSSRRIWAANCSSTSAISLMNDGLGQGNWIAIGY